MLLDKHMLTWHPACSHLQPDVMTQSKLFDQAFLFSIGLASGSSALERTVRKFALGHA